MAMLWKCPVCSYECSGSAEEHGCVRCAATMVLAPLSFEQALTAMRDNEITQTSVAPGSQFRIAVVKGVDVLQERAIFHPEGSPRPSMSSWNPVNRASWSWQDLIRDTNWRVVTLLEDLE